MPLNVLGCTRATLTESASMSYADRCGESCETLSCWGLIFEILDHQRGIPSKRKSAACVDYVPALCTHRLSLLLNEWFSEVSGSAVLGAATLPVARREAGQTLLFRGSKSRNKVSLIEPAEGSLPFSRYFLTPPCTDPGSRASWPVSTRFPRKGGWSGSFPAEVGAALSCPQDVFPRNVLNFFFLLDFWPRRVTNSNDGPLGSCIDEERSKLRYLV